MNQKMYLITGLMACGKSTISDLLAKSLCSKFSENQLPHLATADEGGNLLLSGISHLLCS